MALNAILKFKNYRRSPRRRACTRVLYSIGEFYWPTRKQKIRRHENRSRARVRRRYFSADTSDSRKYLWQAIETRVKVCEKREMLWVLERKGSIVLGLFFYRVM